MGHPRTRKKKGHIRRRPRANPRGIMVARAGGFGFVRTAEGEFFISQYNMGGAFDGDLVEVAPITPNDDKKSAGEGEDGDRGPARRPGGRVLRVLDRAHDTLLGRYEVAEPFGVVVPEDPRIPYDIFTMRSESPDVPDGAIVRVRMVEYPTRRTAATGVVEEVIGSEDDEHIGIDLIIARHKLETRFSEGTLAEAEAAVLDEAGALAEGYRDICDRYIFTIDPADARDFDDALSLDPLEDGRWRLGVHIADVSHYVPWGSSTDLDARRRATSVYLVDRVIPMLPEKLSNELCSLKPGEVRRCFTVDMVLDADGTVVSSDFYPALMRSRARLSYEEALAIIEGTDEASEKAADADLVTRLRQAASLADVLGAKRTARGGIDFSTVEAKMRLDEEGQPIAIALRTENAATELIEQAMILANETVASHLAQRGWPCLFRIHEQPSADSLEALVPVLQEFPWFTQAMAARLVTGDPHVIQRILAASEGRAEHELVTALMLRSMKRAVYSPHKDVHYGLASEAYCHFTSPIRRYPDLVVHRMLRAQLTGRPEKFDQEKNALPWVAEHSSDMERIAETASRESQELKMVEYLQRFVGTAFSGTICGVTTFGVFVRLDNTAEGLLPVRSLGDEYFSFDPARYTLVGEESGQMFRLGERIEVVLKMADLRARKLEFELA